MKMKHEINKDAAAGAAAPAAASRETTVKHRGRGGRIRGGPGAGCGKESEF